MSTHNVFIHDLHLSYEGDGKDIHVDPIANDECCVRLGTITLDMHSDNAYDLHALLGEYLEARWRHGVQCTSCNGSGEGRAAGTICPDCQGRGEVAA
jgi:hypothetical protein